MSKQVALVTTHQGYNFGALLQAYALQQTILRLGYHCRIVDYTVPMYGGRYLFQASFSRSGLSRNLHVLRSLRAQVQLRRRFAAFRAAHLQRTARAYSRFADLAAESPQFDTYVVGSDIVWHPQFLGSDLGEYFYLTFAGSRRRVAYAPSFGVTEIPAQHQARITSGLQAFAFLSAREQSGSDIIERLTGRVAPNVLDPTLLLSAQDFDKIASPLPETKDYILMYGVQYSRELCELAVAERARLRLPLVVVVSAVHTNPAQYAFADKVVSGVGPSEFLGWVRNAAWVCTNSFHGAAFSIIYRKNFVTTPSAAMNTRTLSLLQRVGLEARQLTNSGVNRPPSDIGEIDYSSVEGRLQRCVQASLAYLTGALG
jgi:hypothetical protein